MKRAVKEKWTTYSLKRGLQSLPEAMTEVLRQKGVKILTQQPCTGLRFTATGVQVQLCSMSLLLEYCCVIVTGGKSAAVFYFSISGVRVQLCYFSLVAECGCCSVLL